MGVAAFYRIPADPFALHHEFALGGSVAGESELLRVVPAGTTLELDVYVPNRDIGFVHVSQPSPKLLRMLGLQMGVKCRSSTSTERY